MRTMTMTNSICNQAVEERQRKELAVEALNQQVTAVGEWSSVIQSPAADDCTTFGWCL